MTIHIREALRQIGITRLAHFTPSKNLNGIVRDGMIRSSKDLAKNAPDYFSPTDRQRFDGHPDKLCCSFEFPNTYYLARARTGAEYVNYPDWVCLLLDPELSLRPGTLFSPCNAATGRGAYLEAGGDALLACFAPNSPATPSSPAGGWARGVNHHPRAATDIQSEALIPAPVELSHLRAIVVVSEESAKLEFGRLKLVGLEPSLLNWVVAPMFFSRSRLPLAIRYGSEIEEREWDPTEVGDRR